MYAIVRPVYAAFSPACDPKWRPESMRARVWYPVYACESGTLRRQDGSQGECMYLHVIGDFGRPARLIASNAILCTEGHNTDERYTACEAVPSGTPA